MALDVAASRRMRLNMGQSRRSHVRVTSVDTPKAEVQRTSRHVEFAISGCEQMQQKPLTRSPHRR